MLTFTDESPSEMPQESHPWEPYIPENARLLVMGTFPPAPNRWSMDFYYPNFINDFWRIVGLIYLGDKEALVDAEHKTFYLDKIKGILNEHGIAMHDTCNQVVRLKGNASDKFLEVNKPVDLTGLLAKMPHLKAIATTGQKAAEVIAELTNTSVPKMGEHVMWGKIAIWRMPSTSRAYPMKLEKKAEYYRKIMNNE
ncbi:MAG: uracil-DNA glycosylase family protein [Bacteroidales bacterium]|nr:uracil-DNA glycosylase family protein [Bacteroidales bacterium]